MLAPADRRVLREALRPPPGYTVDRAIATTYSLDLIALLLAPLSFSFFDHVAARDADGTEDASPLGAATLHQAIRAHAERLTVFCQAGAIAKPARYPQLLAYLEDSVFAAGPPDGSSGVFHPKVWVLRFTSPTGPVRYRVLVNSRNLTFDRSWDTMLALEGTLSDRSNAFARNHPLGEFLEALPDLVADPARRGVATTRTRVVTEEIRRVAFTPPEGFNDEIRFWPLGHDGKKRWPFETRVDQMLVVSPFVTAATLEKLCVKGDGHILVSRSDELAPLTMESLAGFEEVHVLHDGADVEPADGDHEVSTGADEAATGLHAKLYVADAGWQARVWTGSANATRAAFEANVEFLVELTGKKSRVGVDATLGGTDGPMGLRALLVPYTPPPSPVSPDPVKLALEQRLRALRTAIARVPWKARVEREVEAGEDGKERYRIVLWAEATPLDLGPGTEVFCWPIACPREYAAGLTGTAQGQSASFSRLSFQALTSFFAFSVVVSAGGQSSEAVFVVNAPLQGAPEQRHARILHSMLGDPGKVMRFLRMLLALDPLEGIEGLVRDGGGEQVGAGADAGSQAPLLEALLQALDRDPSRIAEFDRAVREMRVTPEGEKLLPPELDEVWLPLREAWESRSPQRGQR